MQRTVLLSKFCPSVRLSVCLSVCQMRVLWKNKTTHCEYFDTTRNGNHSSFLTPTVVGGRCPLPSHRTSVTIMSPRYNLSPAVKTYRRHRRVRTGSASQKTTDLFILDRFRQRTKSILIVATHIRGFVGVGSVGKAAVNAAASIRRWSWHSRAYIVLAYLLFAIKHRIHGVHNKKVFFFKIG